MEVKMKIIRATVLNENFEFVQADLEIENGKILAVEKSLPYREEETVVDCSGYRIVPGFVDIHIHGCAGVDTSDGTKEALGTMSDFLITKGVTSFCPTTMTSDKETILRAVRAAKAVMDKHESGARVVGVNMEGPFISAKRKGAQKEEFIHKPDYAFFKEVYDACCGIIRLVDIAPEEDKDGAFIKEASGLCTVSIAHTTADYTAAKKSFDDGIRHATHLFNAMSGLTHRAPGVVGAVFEDERVTAELICDGHHIHPAVLKTAFQVLGDRAVAVSDSMRGNGLPEGDSFDLGGQMVTVKDGLATLADGTIAGSVTNLHDEVKNLVSYGISLETAVRAATYAPARAIGMEHEIGSIAVGKRADLVVLDADLSIVAVYCG